MDEEKNKKRNQRFLKEFEYWLKNKNLAPKTVKSHISNADLYINNYLIYYEEETAESGIKSIFSFLDDWFIRKCMWSSASSIKSTATSIKKFYQCMYENAHVSKEDYEELSETIKSNMDTFIKSLYDYENEDYDDFF